MSQSFLYLSSLNEVVDADRFPLLGQVSRTSAASSQPRQRERPVLPLEVSAMAAATTVDDLRFLLTRFIRYSSDMKEALRECDATGQAVPEILRAAIVVQSTQHATTTPSLLADTNAEISPTRPRRTPAPDDIWSPPATDHKNVSVGFVGRTRNVVDSSPRSVEPSTEDDHLKFLHRALAFRKNGDRRSEVTCLLQAIATLKTSTVPDPGTACRLLRYTGDAFVALQDYSSAHDYYFDWHLVATKTNDRKQSATALTSLGNLCRRTGDLNGAMHWLKQAESFAS